jgi:plasmid replication initiation protein
MVNKDNKDIIQSYILTVAKYQSNVYIKRILTHIVNANQDYIEGQKISGSVVINIEEDLFKEREYILDIKNILQGENDENYSRVIRAFHSLQGKFIRFDDVDRNHVSVPFIMGLVIKRRSGIAKFRMSELICKAFSDFTKGYRKLEFELTLSFSSVYSIRLYEIMSGQNAPYTQTIEKLKEMFGIEDKYKSKPTNFIKRVIEPAKKELDEKSPYTFTYRINKHGRNYHSITFLPIYQSRFRDEDLERKELQKQISLSWSLNRQITDYLKHAFEFTSMEIKQNIDLLKTAQEQIDLVQFMSRVKPRANRAKNPKGYLINAIKKELSI